MTNAIEQTKRAYAQAMHDMNHHASGCRPSTVLRFRAIEDAVEDHLEELRKGIVAANSVTVACAQHSAESLIDLERLNQELEKKVEYWRFLNGNQAETIIDLQSRLSAMTEERDSIQLRLHAVDRAYKTQQDHIATLMQDSEDRGASEQPGASMAAVIAAVRGAQDIMVEYLVPDGIRAKRAMTKLIPVLDNEKLYSALYELEHAEVKP